MCCDETTNGTNIHFWALLAQIYLLTIEIDLPSDVKNPAILAAGLHLELLKTYI
jgi:hypothetical protein